MRNIINGIIIALLANIAAMASCVDAILITMQKESTEASFEGLDESTAQIIKQVAGKINESHNELEDDSKTILENTRELDKLYYVLAQNILHNQAVIDELQNLIVDAITSSSDAEVAKNRLDALKQEFKALKEEAYK
ncbi:MAG: hypothetical protein LBJ88_04215 [Campylobacteraceae bacterium]|jgi:hypothetical protein|nr:hypothetical protein [Campylobacteraceae bacterium]